MAKAKRGRKRRSITCRIFKHGKSYVMSLPHQLVKALEIKEDDKLAVKIDENRNLIVERYLNEKDADAEVVHARVIGGAKLSGGFYKQLGFTVPLEMAQKIVNEEFQFPIIVEKRGKYFKLLFRRLEKKVEVPA